jgi:8-oxo-dGTP diphosphatase
VFDLGLERNVARGVAVRDRRLLIAQASGSSNYFLPGGGIHQAESAKAALIREVKEELGVTPHVGRFVGVWENLWTRAGTRVFERNFVFTMELPSLGELVEAREAHLSFFWMPFADLPHCVVYPHPLAAVVLQCTELFPSIPEWYSNF